MRTVHRKVTIAHTNDLGAGNVFTSATTAPCRLLKSINGRVATVLEHQASDGHFTHVTAVAIKHEMVLIYLPQNNHVLHLF